MEGGTGPALARLAVQRLSTRRRLLWFRHQRDADR